MAETAPCVPRPAGHPFRTLLRDKRRARLLRYFPILRAEDIRFFSQVYAIGLTSAALILI